MKQCIVAVFFLLITNGNLNSAQSDIGVSFKLNKSLAVIPFAEHEQEGNDNFTDEIKLITGTFGFGVDMFFKVKRRTYFDLSLEYNILSINDDFNPLNDKELSASYAKITFSGISYIDPPDEFTPYFGYGFGLLFLNSNQEEIITEDSFESEPVKGDLLADFTLSLDYKAGLLIPVNEQFSITGDIELSLFFAEYMGLVPKFNLGVIYWLDKK